MTPADIAQAAFHVDAASIPVSLVAVLAVLGDKFIYPTLERAETVTAKIRGELSCIFAEAIMPVVSLSNAQVVRVALVDAAGARLNSASFESGNTLDSEAFRNAIRECLDDRSKVFDEYWLSSTILRRIKITLRVARFSLCAWPVTAAIGAAFFWAIAHNVTAFDMFWTWASAGISVFPFIAFVSTLPLIARYAGLLDRLGK